MDDNFERLNGAEEGEVRKCVEGGSAEAIKSADGGAAEGGLSARPHPCVIGIGNPLLDIVGTPPLDFFEKYEIEVSRIYLADETKHAKLYDELEEKYNVEYVAGGATQNSIRICQAFFNAPCSTGYIGCIGCDKRGKKMIDLVKAEGVLSLHEYSEKNNDTGVCAVLLHKGERSLCAKLNAANDYELKFLLKSNVWNYIKEAKVFFSAGFFLTVCPAAIVKIGEHCVEHNKIFSMSLAAEFLIEHFKDIMIEALEYADVVFSNDVEYKKFSEIHNYGLESLEEIGERILNLPKKNKKRSRIVVITRGANDVIIVYKDKDEAKLSYIPSIKIADSSIVDLNAAGDAFVGGFLYGLAVNESVNFCAQCGVFAAHHIIQNSGCSFDKNYIFSNFLSHVNNAK